MYSYKAERKREGERCMNVPTILMHERHQCLQDAVDFVGSDSKDLSEQFISDKAAFPSIDPAVRAYVGGLEDFIAGTLWFSLKGRRYFGDGNKEIDRTLLVTLKVGGQCLPPCYVASRHNRSSEAYSSCGEYR